MIEVDTSCGGPGALVSPRGPSWQALRASIRPCIAVFTSGWAVTRLTSHRTHQTSTRAPPGATGATTITVGASTKVLMLAAPRLFLLFHFFSSSLPWVLLHPTLTAHGSLPVGGGGAPRRNQSATVTLATTIRAFRATIGLETTSRSYAGGFFLRRRRIVLGLESAFSLRHPVKG